MQQLDKIKQFTSSVCDQIRWKKVHPMISEEIENHISDQKDAFINEGLDEITSIDKAIEEMGDPVIVGSQLDRTHRPKTAWSMIFLTISLLGIGLVMNFFVAGALSDVPGLYYFNKSVVAAIIGTVCMMIAYFVDFTIIGRHPKMIFAILIVLMIVSAFFAIELNGARRWIRIPILGPVSASLFLLLFPTVYAGIIYNLRSKGYWGIILCGISYAIPAFIFINMYHGGITSVLLYTLSCLILLVISIFKGWFNVKRRYGLLVVFAPTVVISAMFLFVMLSGPASARFYAVLHPNADSGWGYTMFITRDMLSGAIFWGQGTLPKRYTGDITSWLPSIHTDYTITFLIHYVGWIAFVVILSVLVAFIARGFYLCAKQKNVLGRLVSTSVLLTFTIQAVIYISANLGFQFFSQLPLPLISYGGTSTVINLILIGIMLSVFKSGYLVRDNQKITNSSEHKMFEFVDGKIVIDLGKWN